MGQNTLVSPHGTARSLGMGQVGYALADDECALFFNPAGLGVANNRWNGGAASGYREKNYSSINTSYSLAYQNDLLKYAGFGAYVYRDAYPKDRETDSLGTTLRELQPYQMAAALGGGYALLTNGLMTHSIGVSVKYFRFVTYWIEADMSSLKQSVTSTTIGNAASFDVGYLLNLFNCLRLGLTVKNLGPPIWYRDDHSTKTWSQPLMLAAGIGYKNDFGTSTVTILDLANEFSFSRSASLDNFESYKSSIIDRTFATGIELLFLRTIALRFGYDFFRHVNTWEDSTRKSLSLDDSRKISFGFGVRLFNHIEADVYIAWKEPIRNSDYSFYRDPVENRAGASLTFTRLLSWSRADLRWWRRDNQARQ
jgi:hypothetical protein